MKYTLPQLPYSFDALAPYIDAKTMEIHYTKHHQGYVDKLNAALLKHPEVAKKTLEDLLKNLDTVPADIRADVRNQGGGHVNHQFFWTVMKKGGSEIKKGLLFDDVKRHFGQFSSFQEQFARQAVSLFGSGWVWLVANKDGALKIVITQNQDTPISNGQTPILGLDVWEHAYYLAYQNKRADYIAAWWHVVNWDMVETYYEQYKKMR